MSREIIVMLSDDEKRIQAAWDELTKIKGDDKVFHFYDKNGKHICGAKTKSGLPCRVAPIDGRNRCRLHGGASPRGIASPHAKTLRYSKDMIGKALGQRYQEAMEDDDLLALRSEIALFQSRVGEQIQNIDSGDTFKTFQELKKWYQKFLEYNRKGDAVESANALNTIGKLVNKGYGQHQAWAEIKDTVAAIRKLSETEQKRLVSMQQTMTAEQAITMLSYISSVIKQRAFELVDETIARKLLTAVSGDIAKFVNTTANEKYKSIDKMEDND